MRNIGDRINEFESRLTQNVRTFNMIFTEVPIKGFKDTDEVIVGDITKGSCIRLLTIAEFDIEHDFQRKLKSEEIEDEKITIGTSDDDDSDPNWLFYFV